MTHKQRREATTAVDFKEMKVTSPAFTDGDFIPPRYTCDGDNVNPPLDIADIPEDTKCLAIIVKGRRDGKDAWAHWLAWNVPPLNHIKENSVMECEGLNYFSGKHYEGPCPVEGIHHYDFKIYALDTLLELPSNTILPELERAISEHIIGFGVLTGMYQRHQQ